MKKRANILMIVGLVLLLAGIGALGYAQHAKGRIGQAKEDVDTFTNPFTDNPIGKFAQETLRGEASKYDEDVRMLMIGGIILVVVGAFVCIVGLRKR